MTVHLTLASLWLVPAVGLILVAVATSFTAGEADEGGGWDFAARVILALLSIAGAYACVLLALGAAT